MLGAGEFFEESLDGLGAGHAVAVPHQGARVQVQLGERLVEHEDGTERHGVMACH